jgi:hypothetical protein
MRCGRKIRVLNFKIRVSCFAQNHFQAAAQLQFRTVPLGKRAGETKEEKLEKGTSIEVTFFGEQGLSGIVKAIDKVTATIAFGLAFGGWAVTVPRDWIRKREDGWLLEIA